MNRYRVQYTEVKPGGHHDRQDVSVLGDRSDLVRYLSREAGTVLEGSVTIWENVGNVSDARGVNIGGLGWNPEPVAEVVEVPTASTVTLAGARILRRFVTDARVAELNGGTLIFGGRHEAPAARKLDRDGLVERIRESIAYRLTEAGRAWLTANSAAYRMHVAGSAADPEPAPAVEPACYVCHKPANCEAVFVESDVDGGRFVEVRPMCPDAECRGAAEVMGLEFFSVAGDPEVHDEFARLVAEAATIEPVTTPEAPKPAKPNKAEARYLRYLAMSREEIIAAGPQRFRNVTVESCIGLGWARRLTWASGVELTDAGRAVLDATKADATKAPKVTPTQLKTLQTVRDRTDRLFYADVAGQPGAHTHSIDALLRSGLLERFPNPDAGDWRGDAVRLTEAGRAVLALLDAPTVESSGLTMLCDALGMDVFNLSVSLGVKMATIHAWVEGKSRPTKASATKLRAMAQTALAGSLTPGRRARIQALLAALDA